MRIVTSTHSCVAHSHPDSTFLQQTLSAGYPRLLRLFHEFFSKIAVHTDTVYTPEHQSGETVLILRALSSFEKLYLARASQRLNEAVGQAFAGGVRNPPGMTEGTNVARMMANELDSAKFDPLLVRAVARAVKTSLEVFHSRLDALVSRDRAATSLAGPTATAQLAENALVTTCAYTAWSRLRKLEDEYPEVVYGILRPAVAELHVLVDRVVDPLLASMKRELGAIVAKIHSASPPVEMGGSSAYVQEIVEKLNFIKREVFARFRVEDASREWTIALARFVMKVFVLHSSIVKPLDEMRKLTLTNDMTEIEFALSAFIVESPTQKRGQSLEVVGDDYRTLRAMRYVKPVLSLWDTYSEYSRIVRCCSWTTNRLRSQHAQKACPHSSCYTTSSFGRRSTCHIHCTVGSRRSTCVGWRSIARRRHYHLLTGVWLDGRLSLRARVKIRKRRWSMCSLRGPYWLMQGMHDSDGPKVVLIPGYMDTETYVYTRLSKRSP